MPIHRSILCPAAALTALALGLTAPARAVIKGQAAPLNDRRFDCVGIVKADDCSPTGTSGTCVLIDPGLRAGGTLVRGARVLTAGHSLERSWATARFRFRRGVTGRDDSAYPAAETALHCDPARYQELGIRLQGGVWGVTFPDGPPPPAGFDIQMAVVELDGVVANIRPAILDDAPPWAIADGTPLVLAGWGATDLAGTTGRWALRTGQARVYSAVSGPGTVCPAGCGDPDACRACGLVSIVPASAPNDLTCAGMPSYHDSGGALFRSRPNGSSAERGGDLALLGITVNPPSTTGGVCRAYGSSVWLWNHVARAVPPLAAGPGPATGGMSDDDRDGDVDLLDLFSFLDRWFGGLAAADVAAPDGLDVLDVIAFLDAWFAGR